MKAKFTISELLQPSDMLLHYMKLTTAIVGANWLLNDNKEDYYSGFGCILTAVQDYNKSFALLCTADLKAAAASLVRIQMDNLLYLYAEFLNPERVLDKVYNKDKKLADIRIADKPIKQKELLQRLEERFNGVSDIWARYCNFIHPSICHHKIKFNVGRDSVISDMIFINQAITEILEDVASPLEKELKKKS